MQLLGCFFNFLRSKNNFRKITKKNLPTKSWKKYPKKLHTLMAVGRFFFLCSPDCPKQSRSSFPFYKFFYPTISARISGSRLGSRVHGSTYLQMYIKFLHFLHLTLKENLSFYLNLQSFLHIHLEYCLPHEVMKNIFTW